MKQCLKIILLLVIIFARVVAVFSQEQEEDYIPLFNKDGNQKWVWEVHGPPNSREELYNKAVLSEDSDTIINNIAYKKVYRYLYFTSYRKGDVDTTFTSYVREDNKKVYILIDEENIKGEELLYDFSLSVGDTFRLKYNEDFRYSLLSGFATNYFEDVPYPVGTYNSNLLTVIKIDTVNIGGDR
ncbi:MAG: hypothetical protein IJ213_01140 [Bacteroidales bacterium]|nr:hypothetical protein [Bacteroidales bacterium]